MRCGPTRRFALTRPSPRVLATDAEQSRSRGCRHVTNLTGSPAPQPEEYAANHVKLKYLNTGPGSGDDRPEINKSLFVAPGLEFDPLTTHTVHFTLKENTIAGPVMWTATVPPSATLWTVTVLGNGNIRWRYNDPTATFGLKKAQIIRYASFPDLHVWTYARFVNQNVTNAPLTPNVDNAHLMIEIQNGGVGVCYDGASNRCTGNGNTQNCKV